MQSRATTVSEYLQSLPADRRETIETVRQVILDNLPEGYEEGMQYGMIGYFVPHSIFPDGYHCDPRQPLPFVGLASQKHHVSLYLMAVYGSEGVQRWFRQAWTQAVGRLDMGKGCVRFRKLDDVPLEVVGEAVARFPVDVYVAQYQEATKNLASRKVAKKRTGRASAARAAGTRKKK